MVALQFLVLSAVVRIRLGQLKKLNRQLAIQVFLFLENLESLENLETLEPLENLEIPLP